MESARRSMREKGKQMAELESILNLVAQSLQEEGVEPVTEVFPGGGRFRYTVPVVALGLIAGTEIQGGFAEYLGEKLDTETGAVTEIYGKRLGLTLDLFIHSPEGENLGAKGCLLTLEKVLRVLSHLPQGIHAEEISWGETAYDKSTEMYRSCASVKLSAYLYAESGEEQEFLDFNLKGVPK